MNLSWLHVQQYYAFNNYFSLNAQVVFVVRWAKNDATLRQFEEMITQAFENAGRFIQLTAVHFSLLTFICAAPTWAAGSLIQVAKDSISILRELGVVKLTIGQEIVLHDKEVSKYEYGMLSSFFIFEACFLQGWMYCNFLYHTGVVIELMLTQRKKIA